jgi:hypothetical protein
MFLHLCLLRHVQFAVESGFKQEFSGRAVH